MPQPQHIMSRIAKSVEQTVLTLQGFSSAFTASATFEYVSKSTDKKVTS